MIAAVIMAGGKGERFWPRSRKDRPKQFLQLVDEYSMIQKSVKRLEGLIDNENIYISTIKEYIELVKEQLPQIPVENIIIEPFGKNTAPCIGLAAIHIQKKHPNATMVVLPSDHLIKNEALFKSSIRHADTIASIGENLVTIGIMPTHPETGYGYINLGKDMNQEYGDNVFKVIKFVEKPDIKTAHRYVESGEYLWNSGMFIWKVGTILNNFNAYLDDIYIGLKKIQETIGTSQYTQMLEVEYEKFDSISIDYGIMEQADRIFVLPGIFGWDDVGSWTALDRIADRDVQGNVIKGNVIIENSKNCIVEAESKLVVVNGMDNIIVVDTCDAILICNKDEAQSIKNILNILKEQNSDKYL